MLSSIIRPRVFVLLALVASLGSVANSAQAEPIFIGGFGFMRPHPTLGNEGFQILTPFAAAFVANTPESNFGLVPAFAIKLDLTTYATAADTLVLEDAVFDVDTNADTISDGTITFSFSPAKFTQVPPPSGIIGSGDIQATIIGVSTTLGSVSVSQFLGGSFQMTFTGAKITAGAGASGGGKIVFDPVPTSSFTISTPEPTSVALAVMGSLGVLGLCYRLRRA